jgi:hypothetical protein
MIRGNRLLALFAMSPRTPTFWSGKARPSV